MPDDFNPYREWLGLGNDRAPNYYELLGLSPGESDVQRIAAAAERTRTKVRSFRPGPHARAWSQLLDEIQAAKECLCDATKRDAYDAGLASWTVTPRAAPTNPDLFPPSAARASLPASTQDSPAESSIPTYPMAVPVGDPIAAAATIAEHAEPTLLDPMTPLEADVVLPPGVDPQFSSVADIAPEYVPTAFAPSGVAASVTDGVQPTTEQPVAISSAPSPATIAAQRQRQSSRGLVLLLVVALSLIVGVSGTSFVLSKRSPSRTYRAPSAPPVVAVAPSPPSTAKTPITTDNSASASSETSSSELLPLQTPPAAAPPPETSPAPPSIAASSPPALSIPPAPAAQPQVALEQVQSLIKTLETAKVAIAEHNFTLADSELDKAASLAVLPKHKEAVARLKEVGGYIKQFREAVAAAVRGMQAGETFKVGNSTQVSFVEGFNDKVILRTAGMNRTYPFNDMPPGLAVAIADFKLPASNPMSRVVKGAYLLLHKRADSQTQDKGRALWQEAQAAGANIGHLMPFLSDNYADFVKDVAASQK